MSERMSPTRHVPERTFKIERTSGNATETVREINSIEELIAFAKENECDIILKGPWTNGGPAKPTLEIYDDYRE